MTDGVDILTLNTDTDSVKITNVKCKLNIKFSLVYL